ncbi:MAG: hypothetical protein ACJ71C_05650 [Nitrososphaeraceae archaeon]
MTNSRIVSKNVLAYGAIFVAAILLLTAAVSSAVLAQTSSTGSKNAATAATTTSPNQRNLPNASPVNITGSIPLGSTISSAISSKVKTLGKRSRIREMV